MNDDQTLRIKAETIKPGAVREAGLVGGGSLDDPQNRPVLVARQTREDGGGEAGRGGGVAGKRAADFVERIAAKSTGEHAVEAGNREGQHGR